MADILNTPNCGGTTGTFNSGIPLCDVIAGGLLGIIGLDAGAHFTPAHRASLSSFLAELRVKVKAARGSRAYPFWRLTNFEDKSKEPTKAGTGNLTNSEITVADGVPSFGFQHRIGELFHKKLMEAQSAGLTWLLVDKNYVVYGTVDGVNFTGYSTSEFYVGIRKFGNNSTGSVYPFDITFASQAEHKENLALVQASSAITAITGLRDVVLDASIAVSVLSVGLTAIGGTNIAQTYATELAQTGAWDIKKVSSGAAVTVSPVYNSGTGKMEITLSGTPWTGATTGDDFSVNLVAPSALAGLTSPIDGYESTGLVLFDKP